MKRFLWNASILSPGIFYINKIKHINSLIPVKNSKWHMLIVTLRLSRMTGYWPQCFSIKSVSSPIRHSLNTFLFSSSISRLSVIPKKYSAIVRIIVFPNLRARKAISGALLSIKTFKNGVLSTNKFLHSLKSFQLDVSGSACSPVIFVSAKEKLKTAVNNYSLGRPFKHWYNFICIKLTSW